MPATPFFHGLMLQLSLMNSPSNNQGFSLVELVVVMIIIAVLAATFLPKTSDRVVNVNAQADMIGGDVRYVQSLAMTQGQRYYIDFPTPTTYGLFAVSGAVAIPHPATGSTTPISLAAGITAVMSTPVIAFDGKGVPYTDTAATTVLSGVNAVITLSGGNATAVVSVFPETGRVTP